MFAVEKYAYDYMRGGGEISCVELISLVPKTQIGDNKGLVPHPSLNLCGLIRTHKQNTT